MIKLLFFKKHTLNHLIITDMIPLLFDEVINLIILLNIN